jgi:hypothetical protein
MVASPQPQKLQPTLDVLDRVAVVYLTLPLVVFLVGWFKIWAALPLLACVAYSLKGLAAPRLSGAAGWPVTPLQLKVAVIAACAWTFFGGVGHFVFANADWHVRDAVLHDVVSGQWPVGYGIHDGLVTLLRAPLGYYLVPAVVGKGFGLPAAHLFMGAWTAFGTTLFLLQVLSLMPSRLSISIMAVLVIVMFSGFDIIGNLLNDGPHFRYYWKIATHLEWWAGSYQYSSITTQLFWVPNHAIGGWLAVGMLCRAKGGKQLDAMLPMIVIAAALWSPLSALGLLPFVFWRILTTLARDRDFSLLLPNVWAPALVVGGLVAAYFALDLGGISKGVSVGQRGAADVVMDVLMQAQFFLLEAGILGIAILLIRPSAQVIVALVVLAILPVVRFGPGNDLVMRGSIPSLAVLAIASCLALFEDGSRIPATLNKRIALGLLLLVGAVTPIAEFARAIVLPKWPINLDATLIGANCGAYPAHYVARLRTETIARILRPTHAIAVGPNACVNPAVVLMVHGGLLQ